MTVPVHKATRWALRVNRTASGFGVDLIAGEAQCGVGVPLTAEGSQSAAQRPSLGVGTEPHEQDTATAWFFRDCVGCGALVAAPAGGAVLSNTTSSFSNVPFVFTDCVNGGAGETVFFTGDIHVVFAVTTDGAGGVHVEGHANLRGTGVGATTGNTYKVNGDNPFVSDLSQNTTGGASEFTAIDNNRVISKGSDGNLIFRFFIHVTINANGTVTSNVVATQVICT